MARDNGQRPRADPDVLKGVSGSLRQAYALGGAGDAGLEQALDRLDGIYQPDIVADARMDQLIERLKRLPWGDPGTSPPSTTARP